MADMTKSFAEDLKATREEKNLSLRSISQQTRLSLSILENLEHGDFTFQPQAYIRAFLKQYIASLDLDVDETLFDYDLAKSGKYKTKRVNVPPPAPPPERTAGIETESPEDKTGKSKITEKLKEIADVPKNVSEEKSPEIIDGVTQHEIPKTKPETREVRAESRNTSSPPPDRSYMYTPKVKDARKFSFSFLSSPVVRNIFLIVFAILVLLGLYSLVNILFFDGSKKSPEVIRQNFDDVVKEQEKKILGKRTPEEIQDSIRKADEEFLAAKDSITLKVTGLTDGVLYIVTDSVNYSKPDKIEFKKNSVGTFKALRTFYISSPKTETFKATINDIPIKFGQTAVSKVKVNKNGIVK